MSPRWGLGGLFVVYSINMSPRWGFESVLRVGGTVIFCHASGTINRF